VRHLDVDGIVLFPFKYGESDAERIERLAALAGAAPAPWGIMPAPVGEPFGLDTLRCFALCRLALPQVPHLLADVTTLGPRLAQMAFGFGADELYAPIVAERALRIGANANNPALTRKEAATLLRGAGLVPCERMADGSFQEVTP
jgi:2-iminoacetate synthase ThiH